MFSIDNLGEKTLNKIAEMALMSQINDAQKLTVEIKTDPTGLAKGMLNSLAIKGEGLIMNKSLRMQRMRIDLDSIAVKPFPALLGNIQLTRPSRGTIDVVFNESDIENILRSHLDELESIKCTIAAGEDIEITLKLKSRTGFTLGLKPGIEPGSSRVEVSETRSDATISPALKEAIVRPLEKLFNLEQFQIDGVSVILATVNIDGNSIYLRGAASITHFPRG